MTHLETAIKYEIMVNFNELSQATISVGIFCEGKLGIKHSVSL